jgi:hypothetical protein
MKTLIAQLPETTVNQVTPPMAIALLLAQVT